MSDLDIVERLRGKVRVSVNDGAGLLDGLDYFERQFPTSKAAMEAAAEIERLRNQLVNARADAIEECAKIAMTAGCGDPQCMDCYGNQIAATIRDLALPTAIEMRGILTDDLQSTSVPSLEQIARVLAFEDSRQYILATSDDSELHHAGDGNWNDFLPHAKAVFANFLAPVTSAQGTSE